MNTIELTWHGPYKWFDSSGNSIVATDLISRYGIYTWTIAYQGAYLVYYVGETGATQSFAQRLRGHARSYLTGQYQIHDPAEFAAGRHKVLRPGGWKTAPGPEWPQFETVRPQAYQLLSQLYLLLAPLAADNRIRKRIEGAVAKATQRYPRPGEPKGGFQEAEIRYALRRPDEVPIRVVVKCPVIVLGLDSELIA